MKAIHAGLCLALIIYTFRVGFSQLGKHSGYNNKKSTINNKGTYNNKEYKQGRADPQRVCKVCQWSQ